MPQVEDGYTKLANELLEAMIAYGLGKREWTVLMAVIRKTYGFNKKSDDMTLTQIANMTGLDLAHVSRTVASLTAKNILLKRQGKYGYVLGINKNYGTWDGLPKQQLAKTASQGCQNSKPRLPKEQTQKKTPKETIKRGGFTPPSVEEVSAYCDERRNGIDAEQFVAFYDAKNWMLGKNKMANWKAAVITWEKRKKQDAPSSMPYGAGGL